MTIGERVNKLRKESLKLTLDEFGGRLGVTKMAISRIENDSRALTDQMCKSICREFHVNEAWLRTGEGEMFQDRNLGEEIASFFADLPETSFKKRFIAMLASLGEPEWEVLERMALVMQEEPRREETIDGMTREEYHAMIDREFDAKEKKGEPPEAVGIA